MAKADASRGRIVYRPESTYAEAPPANAATTRVRFVNESLKHENITVVSEELRSDRQRSDLVLVGTNVSGEINAELSYGNFDWLLEAVLCGSWGTPSANVLRNGVTNRSFTIEKGFLDVAKYLSYRGCVINSLNIDITSRRILRLTASVMGSKGYAAATSMAGSTTPTEPNSNQIITAGRLIQLFNSGGSNIELDGIKTKDLKLNISNNLRARDVATQDANDDPGRGVMEITGSFNAYFEDLTVYNGFLANSLFSLRFTMSDPVDDAKTYRITLPALKLPDTNPALGGVESDVMLPVTFRALLDGAVGYAINVERAVDLSP